MKIATPSAHAEDGFHRHVFIGLGSNQGERLSWLEAARARLQGAKTILLLQQSAIYETEPLGLSEQPSFLNQVVEVATSLTPQSLLDNLLKIENELGRVRTQRWGPRNIDLDLLAYRDCEINSASLQLPHSEIPKRRFVLEPWREIAPDFKVPKWRLTVAELFDRCEDFGKVLLWKKLA